MFQIKVVWVEGVQIMVKLILKIINFFKSKIIAIFLNVIMIFCYII